MLVLSRKSGERINIGDDIIVEVRRVAGNRVTLAIEAPRRVRILRGELCDAAKQFEQESSRSDAAEKSAKSEPYFVAHHRFASVEHHHPTA